MKFENFAFEKRAKVVTGYHFPCPEAEYVLCIIHGIGEHAGRYQRMADYLEKSKVAVLSMDLRGHGISSGKRGDAAPRTEVLGDVDALIEYAQEFYPQTPIILMGHSMGGNICLDYKGRGKYNDVPVKYIVTSPWIKLVKDFPKPVVSMLRAASKVVPTVQISQGFPDDDLGNPNFVKPYSTNPLVHGKITLRCAAEGFDMGNAIYDGLNPDNHKADDKPFLLMAGDLDVICDVEGSRHVAQRYSQLPDFRYIEWAGYKHEIHNGGPDKTGEEVLETLAKFIEGRLE